MGLTITLCLVAMAIGIVVTLKSCTRPIEIKMSYLPLEWPVPILSVFLFFAVLYFVDIVISILIVGKIDNSLQVYILLKIILENGLFVPFICVILSRTFELLVEGFNLDLLDGYDVIISKICLSIIVLFWSVFILGLYWTDLTQMNEVVTFIVNRTLVWILTVIGMPFSLGFRCNGRIAEDNKLRERSKKVFDCKGFVNLWVPIIISLLSCGLLLGGMFFFEEKIEKYEGYYIAIATSFFIAVFITMKILNNKNNPSMNNSKRRFYRFIRDYKTKKNLIGKFGRNRYHIENNMLCIEPINIKYAGHENEEEFIELFGAKQKVFKPDDYDGMLDYLENRAKKQHSYINDAFENCIEDAKRKKRVKL